MTSLICPIVNPSCHLCMYQADPMVSEIHLPLLHCGNESLCSLIDRTKHAGSPRKSGTPVKLSLKDVDSRVDVLLKSGHDSRQVGSCIKNKLHQKGLMAACAAQNYSQIAATS